MTCWRCFAYVQDLPKKVDEGGNTNDIVKEAAKSMDGITGDVGDMDEKGFKELIAPSMPTDSTKAKLVVDIDNDDFMDRTPFVKRLGRRHPFSVCIHKLAGQTCPTLAMALMR